MIDFSNLGKGIVMVFEPGLFERVQEVRNFQIVTKMPEWKEHYISVVVLDNANPKSVNWDNIITQVKEQYNDNLVSISEFKDNQLYKL